jgi:hypothetical protein
MDHEGMQARKAEQLFDDEFESTPSNSLASKATVEQPHAKQKAKEQPRAKAKVAAGATGSKVRQGNLNDSASFEESSMERPPTWPGSRQQLGDRGQQGGLSSYKQRQQATTGASNNIGAGMSAYKMRQQFAGNTTSAKAVKGRKPGGLGGFAGGTSSLLSRVKTDPSWGSAAGAESGDEIVDDL